MNKFQIRIDPEALSDIREITGWYNRQKAGLGNSFRNTVIKQIEGLAENPQIFTIRYKEIRCMLVCKFPYMVHFYLDERSSAVDILAIISTDRTSKIWEERTQKI